MYIAKIHLAATKPACGFIHCNMANSRLSLVLTFGKSSLISHTAPPLNYVLTPLYPSEKVVLQMKATKICRCLLRRDCRPIYGSGGIDAESALYKRAYRQTIKSFVC